MYQGVDKSRLSADSAQSFSTPGCGGRRSNGLRIAGGGGRTRVNDCGGRIRMRSTLPLDVTSNAAPYSMPNSVPKRTPTGLIGGGGRRAASGGAPSFIGGGGSGIGRSRLAPLPY